MTQCDADGRVTESLDGAGDASYRYYDAGGRLTEAVDARGGITRRFYDGDGNLTGLVDAVSNSTTFAFDADNHPVGLTDPLGHLATWLYDADGRLTEVIDRLGRTQKFTFDDDGRPTRAVWADASGTPVNTLTYAFDQDGNLTNAADSHGAYTLTYDPANRLTNVQEPFGLSLTFSYDPVSHRTLVTDSQGGTTTSVFDGDGQLTSRQFSGNSASLRFDETWLADGQLGTTTRYAGLTTATVVGTTSLTYDPGGRETAAVHKNGAGTSLDLYVYGFDQADRLTSEADNGGAATTYQYDTTSELTQAGATTYGYDLTGNRTNTGYTTSTDNRLSGDGTYTYTYDTEGNRLTKRNGTDLTTYTYDTLRNGGGMTRTWHGVGTLIPPDFAREG